MVLILKKGATEKEMKTIAEKMEKPKGVDTKKFCGVIKLDEEPLAIQKQMRDEWK